MLDKSSVPEGETTKAQPTQQQCPPDWAETQDALAAAAGLSVLLVESNQPPALHVSNNNSICRAFQSSPTRRRLCDPFCGVAHERALSAGAATHYRCHAGLHCFAMPVGVEGRALAVIGGRAFLTTADYRVLAERLRTGDLQDLLSSDLFKNVIFAARQDLDDLAKRIATAAEEYRMEARDVPPAAAREATEQVTPGTMAGAVTEEQEYAEASGSGGTAVATTEIAFQEACVEALRAFSEKHGLTSIALLSRDKQALASSYATGLFSGETIRVELGPKDTRLAQTARASSSIVLTETANGFKPVRAGTARQEKLDPKKTVELFPLVVGDEVKGALLVRGVSLSEAKRQAITEFCRDIAWQLEVLRLRSELEERARFADQLTRFTEGINAANPAETYLSILRHSAELLQAERGSLLLFDEDSNELAMKAAVGFAAGVPEDLRLRLGDGISGAVLEKGQPLVVRDLEQSGHTPAPAERRYKTKSFISYPIMVGGRRVGVLNVTDKAGGGSYDEIDLSLLETIAPQMALALDRAGWHGKAEQFQLMSITDPLTGLLNRRYLEERLTEELKRSTRQSYAMSFMMIDIDDFKVYNDRNGHQAGDLALEMTSQCLKSALRSADVASRYGGEEFSILLPQTTLDEACAIAERIRRRVQRTRFPHGKTQPLGAVTISIGVSTFSPAIDTPAAIIGAADRALYSAKSLGKNQVFASQDQASERASSSDVSKDTK